MDDPFASRMCRDRGWQFLPCEALWSLANFAYAERETSGLPGFTTGTNLRSSRVACTTIANKNGSKKSLAVTVSSAGSGVSAETGVTMKIFLNFS